MLRGQIASGHPPTSPTPRWDFCRRAESTSRLLGACSLEDLTRLMDWADYWISAVTYNDRQIHIVAVELRANNMGKVGTAKQTTREHVVALLQCVDGLHAHR
jgi:hypothetical protein